MTQSGQGEEPSPRQAREGIVLPSDGGEPLLPGMQGGQGADPRNGHQGGPHTGHHGGSYAGHQPGGPQTPTSAPPGGQSWGTPWGPDRHQNPDAPPPAQSWPAAPAQPWDASDQYRQPSPDQWGAPQAGPSQPLPPEGGPSASYGPGAPLPPAAPDAYGAQAAPGAYGSPLPPAADQGATQYIPPVAAAPGAEGATQYLPPVPPPADEGATQYIPPVGPGALPPEAAGYQGAGPLPPAADPDAQATQYIAPVTDASPYGTQPGGDRQPPAEFDNLFRSAAGGESPAAATQQLPRFEQPQPQAARPGYGYPHPQSQAAQPPYGGQAPQTSYDAPRGKRGGGSGSRVPLIAAVGVGIVVLGVGAGALLGGGGDGKAKNQTVSATAPATGGSASPSTDAAKQQAVALDKLLADSGDSRASVIRAVADVKACRNLGGAASDLRDAAKQRGELVTRLSGLSVDRLANHAALTTALTQAWQASASADNHYAAWAGQVGGKKGCKKGQARTTGQTLAGNRASGTASAQKVKAAALWNTIAQTYGLTRRQPTQL